MRIRKRIFLIAVLGTLGLAACANTEAVQPVVAAPAPEKPIQMFAVEIKVGPNWDHSKAPNEQAFFGEHSANMQRLRQAGHILMGARYSDIGLIIFSASSPDEIDKWMSEDASMTAGTFQYQVHAMSVFYPWRVSP